MCTKRSFHYLWIGQTLANCGDLFYIVGLISILYKATGSGTLMAFVPFVITISRFLGGIGAPWVIDRYPLRKILVYSQLAKSILLCIVSIYLLTLFQPDRVYFIFPLVALIAFLDGWATPARNAILPRLIKSEDLIKANSFISIVDQIVQLGGWPIGGMLVAIFNGGFLVALTVILFFISTFMMAFIRDNEEKTVRASSTSKWNSLKEGWLAIWITPSLKTVAFIDFIDAISNVVWIAAILYLYVEDILHQSEAWWGYINSTFFAGLILGGLLSFKRESFMKENSQFGICAGTLFVGIFTLSFGLSPFPLLSLFLSVLVGLATQIKAISQQTVIQLTSPDHLLPKVLSARDAIFTGAFGISSLIFGYLAETYGVRTVFIIAALLLTMSAIWGYFRKKYLKLEPAGSFKELHLRFQSK
ncbi:MFS transporter [Fictibacillus sp. Mic-4]|uniref:MFS transporter n=1 Tax=Fictibacillus sp. Mic-4 TaxID=3132826 RepID=UPI003CEE801D